MWPEVQAEGRKGPFLDRPQLSSEEFSVLCLAHKSSALGARYGGAEFICLQTVPPAYHNKLLKDAPALSTGPVLLDNRSGQGLRVLTGREGVLLGREQGEN